MVSSGLQIGFSASLGLVQRSGADVDKFMSILRASALYAPTYDKKLQKMLSRDFGTANFPTKVCQCAIVCDRRGHRAWFVMEARAFVLHKEHLHPI